MAYFVPQPTNPEVTNNVNMWRSIIKYNKFIAGLYYHKELMYHTLNTGLFTYFYNVSAFKCM